MGRPRLVVNMKTSPLFLFSFLILWVGTTAAGAEKPEIGDHGSGNKHKCKPEEKKPCEKNFQRCQDDDYDGHWECACEKDYEEDLDGNCQFSNCMLYGTAKQGYRTDRKISKKCYYFETKALNYTAAADNCKGKFNGQGRLFEPRDVNTNDAVVAIAQSFYPNEEFWLGIRSRPHDQNFEDSRFYYLSEGPQGKSPFGGWSPGEPNDISGQDDCTMVLHFNELTWRDSKCDAQKYAICEIDEKEACGSPHYAHDNFCDDENNKPGCNYDGGACCNRDKWTFKGWDDYCTECKCKEPERPTVEPPCEDDFKPSVCKKKCKGKKCKTSSLCKEGCKKHCWLCGN